MGMRGGGGWEGPNSGRADWWADLEIGKWHESVVLCYGGYVNTSVSLFSNIGRAFSSSFFGSEVLMVSVRERQRNEQGSETTGWERR